MPIIFKEKGQFVVTASANWFRCKGSKGSGDTGKEHEREDRERESGLNSLQGNPQ